MLEKQINELKLSSKIKKIIQNSNQILLENLNSKESFNKLYKQFKKLVRLSNIKISNLDNENDFTEFMYGLQKIFENIEIKKLYNLSNRDNLKEFDKLDLFSQFLYISIPYKNKNSFDFIKGGVCYHWLIFFYNFFNFIDKKNKLDKEIIYFNREFKHSVFLLGYKNIKYIIDPYNKSNLITEVKNGERVYLIMDRNGLIYGTIKDDEKLVYNKKDDEKLVYNEKEVKFDIYKDKKSFFKSIKPIKNFLVNIKTYVDGKSIYLIIKQYDEYISINFDGHEQWNDKELTIMNIMNPIMEGKVKKISSFFLLKQILGIKKMSGTNDKIIQNLKVISEKISSDYLIEKLGIKEDIKMFI